MIRIGHGYDVHRLVEGRKLIIGGVEIPHDTGLLGHSDADVLLHAISDSLLGAAALGDIGKLFPDNDKKIRGCRQPDTPQKGSYTHLLRGIQDSQYRLYRHSTSTQAVSSHSKNEGKHRKSP